MNNVIQNIDFIVQDDSPRIISSSVLASTPDNSNHHEYAAEDSDETTEEYVRWVLDFTRSSMKQQLDLLYNH